MKLHPHTLKEPEGGPRKATTRDTRGGRGREGERGRERQANEMQTSKVLDNEPINFEALIDEGFEEPIQEIVEARPRDLQREEGVEEEAEQEVEEEAAKLEERTE